MERYDHRKIEEKWRAQWKEANVYKTTEDPGKEKFYILDMFPYPSGAGLHVGHPKGYIATDIMSRYKKMRGYNVLHPMGWDAFGLPAEQYALKNKVHPRIAVDKNIATFKKQLDKISLNYDWEREISTTDPGFYKWTQWAFIQMFNKGLVYQSNEPINWCPSCKTGLANEDLEDGACERCGTPIEKKKIPQWVIKITDYADRMLADLDGLDWQDSIKESQRNWIGRSKGAEIEFPLVIAGEAKQSRSKKREIKNVVFDLGGVLNYIGSRKEILEKIGVDSDFNNQPEKLRALAKTAQQEDSDDYYNALQEHYGDAVTKDRFIDTLITPNEEVLNFVRTLKKRGYKLYILSNITKDVISRFLQQSDLKEVFDGAIESCVVGCEKPDKKIYNTLLETYNLKAHETLFIDDREENINAGKKVGMHGIVCSDTQQCIADIEAIIDNNHDSIKVFTTRPDTLFGATYLVLAPEHELVEKLLSSCHSRGSGNPEFENGNMDPRLRGDDTQEKACIENAEEVQAYIAEAQKKSEIERTAKSKEKTGVKLEGVMAVNPANGEEIPVYIADYVLADYGTGAIMAVPAHDERDWKFAKKYNLDINPVIASLNNWRDFDGEKIEYSEEIRGSDGKQYFISHNEVYTGTGIMVHSGQFSGMDSEEAKEKITEKVGGKMTVSYKLRDWVFARQRYWGEPIPLIHCEKCGVVPVPEDALPVVLPDVESYEPTGTGESPLAAIDEWVNVKCPECGGPAKRETNTMPQWAGSSWYYLRYIDPKNEHALVDKDKEKYWSPVDFYVGGAEHATRHLIYARFWHKFLYDIGVVSYDEPFTKLQTVGLIMAEDGRKMSKRWGNVVNPDEIIERYGADTLRLYEMFMGPFDATVAWSADGLVGPRKFLERLWKISEKVGDPSSARLQKAIHAAIKKVGEDIEEMKYNTAISAMMVAFNEMEKAGSIARTDFEAFLKILSPFAPHVTQELWDQLGNETLLIGETWPTFDAQLLVEDEIVLVVQVNGKVRDNITLPAGLDDAELAKKAQESTKVQKYTDGKEIRKVIVVKGKLVNIVV